MRKLSTDEIKKIQINILDKIVDYCDEEGLIYFLGYGTLLGAVRHQGYIPWDDDIDILMPRSDYEKLIKNFRSEDYQIYTNEINNAYYYSFAKASYNKSVLKENMDNSFEELGINIDIFPLDGCPKSQEECRNKFNTIEQKRKLLYAYVAPSNRNRKWYRELYVRFGKFILSFINFSKMIKTMNEIAAEYDYYKADKVGNLVFNSGYYEIMDKEIFKNRINLKFEGKNYYVPGDYDKYLTTIYGDYMKLPPVEERVTHHDFEAFIK